MASRFLILLFLVLSAGMPAEAGVCRRLFGPGETSTYLATTDRAEINHLIEEMLPFSRDFTPADNLAHELSRADVAVRTLWLDVMMANYRSYSKSSLTEGGYKFGLRRFADRVIFQVLRGDVVIREELGKGASPFQAFAKYHDAIAPRFGSKYDAKLVREILREVQRELRAMEGNQDRTFIVGGSFVNGRGDLRASDLDIINHANPKQGEAMDLANGLQRIAKSVDPQARLAPEYHATKLPDHSFGLLHPVAFRVTPDKVELMIYEPPAPVNGRQFGFNADAHRPVLIVELD